ncbi:MAG TPA: hybrid sensor histidine kinase/response regulator [Candidatus Limnocylindrales bacterium]|nr:hybrid sensor histidine kinase/response regulator [Candidatus Limnocylindrales bacterium]
MPIDQAKFRARFVEEAREHIQKLNESLLNLEKNPEDSEAVNAIFRSAHTIKGSSKMLKLNAINEVAHKLEDALVALREKKIQLSKKLLDLFFKAVDTISDLVDKIVTGQEITAHHRQICEALEKVSQGLEVEIQETKTEEAKKTDIEVEKGEREKVEEALEKKKEETGEKEKIFKEESSKPLLDSKSEILDSKEEPQIPDIAKLIKKGTKSKVDETIRIPAARLDELIKLMGEMVFNQSRLKQRLTDIREIQRLAKKNLELLSQLEIKSSSAEAGFKPALNEEINQTAQTIYQKLTQLVLNIRDDTNLQELLTADLQEKALRMRMLPLSTIFDSFPRVVRDISRSLGKEVNLIIQGGETELDKKIIEKLGDPFLHMIRNAIDHGIEKPEDRRKLGKPETGTLMISAHYEGGSVLIELSDDGSGISLQKIKEKALRKNLFDEATLNTLSESELIDLIFYSGFSTSTLITDVSGRGVGMDVVKKNIVEDLKGTIRIITKEGRGTTFYIRLPLILAITHVLLIRTSDKIFAIPTSSVREILRVPKTEMIEILDKQAIRLHEQLIPVMELNMLLNLPVSKAPEEIDTENLLIVIVHRENEQLGLIIDSLLDEEDMVIKSLPPHMKNNRWVSGVIITGNNETVNVLNVATILEAAKEMKGLKRDRKKTPEEEKRVINILVVDDSINTREIEKSILEAYGYRVTLADDGLEALEKAQKFKYDLIITDIEMPNLDGFSLTEKLRKDNQYKNTPIIIVTSREKEEDKRKGIQVGADAYIIKGAFDQSNLLETVQSLIG